MSTTTSPRIDEADSDRRTLLDRVDDWHEKKNHRIDDDELRPAFGMRIYDAAHKSHFGQTISRYGRTDRMFANLDDLSVATALAIAWGGTLIASFLGRLIRGSIPWYVSATALLLLGAVTGIVVSFWLAYRESPQRRRHDLMARECFASPRAVREVYGEQAARATAATTRREFSEAVAEASRPQVIAQAILTDTDSLEPAGLDEAVAAQAEALNMLLEAAASDEPGKADRVAELEGQLAAAQRRVQALQDGGEPVAFAPSYMCNERRRVARPYGACDGTVLDCAVPPVVGGTAVQARDLAFLIGYSHGEPVWLPIERPMYGWGAARSGKGVGIVINAIIDAPGAVITTSTRPDNMEATAVCRAARGPIAVFNLNEVGNRPHTIKWNPLEGCKDPHVAVKRAEHACRCDRDDAQQRRVGPGGEIHCRRHFARRRPRRTLPH